jgi:hypothetical protein
MDRVTFWVVEAQKIRKTYPVLPFANKRTSPGRLVFLCPISGRVRLVVHLLSPCRRFQKPCRDGFFEPVFGACTAPGFNKVKTIKRTIPGAAMKKLAVVA